MPSNFGSTPYSSETLPANTFPVSAVFVPGTASGNLTAMQGGPATTDGNSYTSAPGSIYIADGNDVTQGTSTDAAGHNSVIGQLKQIQTNTASVTIGSGTVTANQGGSWAVTANAGTNLNTSALALESGGNLAAILADTADIEINTANIPPLGQALAAGSVPVVLTAAQQTALTPPAAITGFALEAGHLATIDTHTPALGQAAMAASVPVTIASNQSAVPVSGTFWQATQPVSGTVTANAGTGTFTIQSNASVNVNQVAGSSVATAATGIMKVGLTDGSGNAITSTSNALNVNIASGGGSGFSVTDETAWTAGTSAMVPTGGVFNDSAAALTSGQEGTVRVTNNRAIHSNLRDASGNQLLGSKTSANSIPVVIASDQGAVAVSGTFWQTTQPISGTVTANTNADTTIGGTSAPSKGLLVIGKTNDGTPQYQPLPEGTGGRSVIVEGFTGGTAVPVSGTFWQATQPVSGTVTANAGTGSFTVAQATGSNLHVVLDSGSTTAVTQATGTNLHTVVDSGTVTANQGGSNWSVNVAQIGASSVVTATTGVQKVGIVGNAGAAVDSTVGAGTAPANALVMGAVYNTSAPAPTNGQAMAVQADQAGNARTFPGISLAALSAWNNGTALNATQNIFTNSGCVAALVQIDQTTTITGGAITFEVTYDGANWVTATANSVLDPTSSSFAQIAIPYTLQASTNKPFIISGNGWQGLRIKLSTQISGTGTVTPNYALLAYDPADSVIAYSPTAANFLTTASQGGTWTVQPGNTPNSTAWLVQDVAGTTGGATTSHLVSASGTNATNVKNAAGLLYGFSVSNTNAAARYLHLYNTSSAPTVGTTVPVSTVQIPGSATVIRAYPVGATYGTGISFGTSTGAADNDSGSVGAGDLVVDLEYK